MHIFLADKFAANIERLSEYRLLFTFNDYGYYFLLRKFSMCAKKASVFKKEKREAGLSFYNS